MVRNIPFPVGKFHEDVFWSYQAIGRCRRVSVSDQTGYYYLQRNTGIMGDGYSLRRLDAIEARTQRLEYIQKNYPELETVERKSLLFFCIYSLQMAMRNLSKEDYLIARQQILSTLEEHQILHRSMELSPKQQMWVCLARLFLDGTCRIRNIFGIGL